MTSLNIINYVQYGPHAGGNSLAKRFLGTLLWWRMWMTGAIFFAGLIVLYTQTFPVDDRFGGFIIGILTVYVIQIFTPDRESQLDD